MTESFINRVHVFVDMGVFNTIKLDSSVSLPYWPDTEYPVEDIEWQSKNLDAPALETYKITDAGELCKKRLDRREATTEEANDIAQRVTGGEVETWEEWEAMWADRDMSIPWVKEVVDDEWWEDVEYDGSFTFYTSLHKFEDAPDMIAEYEAIFTDGKLESINFVGGRVTDRERAIELMESWV